MWQNVKLRIYGSFFIWWDIVNFILWTSVFLIYIMILYYQRGSIVLSTMNLLRHVERPGVLS